MLVLVKLEVEFGGTHRAGERSPNGWARWKLLVPRPSSSTYQVLAKAAVSSVPNWDQIRQQQELTQLRASEVVNGCQATHVTNIHYE
jgi:hypothetical protein